MNNPAAPQQSSFCSASDNAVYFCPPDVQTSLPSCAVGAQKAEERLKRLQSVVVALGKAITLQQVLDAIMADVLATLGAYVGIIVLLSEDGSRFHMVRSVGYSPEMLQAWGVFPADSPVPVADACKTGESVFLETVEERGRRYPASPVIALNGRAEASVAALPFMEERPFGAIGLRWQEEHVFDAEERAFMQTLANVCAQAITRARLFDAAQRETQERRQAEAALQESQSRFEAFMDNSPALKWITDTQGRILYVNAPCCLAMGWKDKAEVIGRTAFELFPVPLAQRAYDNMRHVATTGQATREVERVFKADGSFREYQIHLIPLPDASQGMLIAGIAVDVTERRKDQERLAALFSDLQWANQQLTHSYDAAIEGWSRALDLRDKETEGHSERVTEMTMQLAQAMGIPGSEWVNLRRGALLHDIGKMGVPDTILLKPGPLTDEEWTVMRRHPEYAYELLYPMTFLHPALDIPIAHHEKWDGGGYPHGLKGEQIPLSARIFAVADVWDALRSDRPYRKGWPIEKVREHIRSLAGTHFDPQVVEIFLRLNVECAGRACDGPNRNQS